MARNTSLSMRLVLLASANLLLGSVVAQSTCYDTWGREDTNQQPCSAPGTDASAATWCCNKGDSCLSNGLCLSPGSNNLMTQQGCTDKNWGGSCNKFCPASNDQKLTAIPLIPCPGSFDSATNAIKFCCGPDPSACCANTSAWISLPPGTIIPSQDTTTTSTSSSSTSESNNSSSLKIGLGIGLGIGIPILLVLLAVAYLLAGQPLHSRRRRQQQQRMKRKHGGGGGTNTEKTSDTSHTYPPPRWFGGGGGRRKSFGHIDTNTTNVRPSTDNDDNHHARRWPGGVGAHAWPPPALVAGHGGGPGSASTNNVARAMAQWARSPFGFGGMEPPPPSPKEMDGSGSCGGRGLRGGRGRRETPSRLGAAELPSPEMNSGEWRGWKGGRRVHVAAEEVELPTPDTPERDVERGLGR